MGELASPSTAFMLRLHSFAYQVKSSYINKFTSYNIMSPTSNRLPLTTLPFKNKKADMGLTSPKLMCQCEGWSQGR